MYCTLYTPGHDLTLSSLSPYVTHRDRYTTPHPTAHDRGAVRRSKVCCVSRSIFHEQALRSPTRTPATNQLRPHAAGKVGPAARVAAIIQELTTRESAATMSRRSSQTLSICNNAIRYTVRSFDAAETFEGSAVAAIASGSIFPMKASPPVIKVRTKSKKRLCGTGASLVGANRRQRALKGRWCRRWLWIDLHVEMWRGALHKAPATDIKVPAREQRARHTLNQRQHFDRAAG